MHQVGDMILYKQDGIDHAIQGVIVVKLSSLGSDFIFRVGYATDSENEYEIAATIFADAILLNITILKENIDNLIRI